MRKLFFEGKTEEGNALANKYLSEKPHSFGTHLPVGDLKMKFMHGDAEVSDYKRELNLKNAITTITYKIADTNYKREYICSNPDDIMLIKITVLSYHWKVKTEKEASRETSGFRSVTHFQKKMN